jgi:hypothetical protein
MRKERVAQASRGRTERAREGAQEGMKGYKSLLRGYLEYFEVLKEVGSRRDLFGRRGRREAERRGQARSF